MSGELPGDLEGVLTAHAACKQTRCNEARLYPAAAVAEPRAPGAVWSYEIARKGAEVSFPKRGGVDLYGIALRGDVALAGVERGAETKKLAAWTAFRAPGAGVRIKANSNGARIVLAAVTDGAPIGDAGKGDQETWDDRPAAIETVDLAAARDLTWKDGAMHARLGFEGADKRASFEILMASLDAQIPQHTHDGSWEILAALRADGTLRVAREGAADLAPVRLDDGAIVAIPKSARHSWEPDGTEPLIAVQIYVPPGPEQRFKDSAGAGATTAPPPPPPGSR